MYILRRIIKNNFSILQLYVVVLRVLCTVYSEYSEIFQKNSAIRSINVNSMYNLLRIIMKLFNKICFT